jgi:hypothetical protein
MKVTLFLKMVFINENESDRLLETDESVSCRPTYLAQTPNDAEGMPLNKIYMVNGETDYYNADVEILTTSHYSLKWMMKSSA